LSDKSYLIETKQIGKYHQWAGIEFKIRKDNLSKNGLGTSEKVSYLKAYVNIGESKTSILKQMTTIVSEVEKSLL
jgi:hypothetical protein